MPCSLLPDTADAGRRLRTLERRGYGQNAFHVSVGTAILQPDCRAGAEICGGNRQVLRTESLMPRPRGPTPRPPLKWLLNVGVGAAGRRRAPLIECSR